MKGSKLKLPFARKNLSPAWEFKVDRIKPGIKIWRLLPAGAGSASVSALLAVELRDTENKTMEFVGIDLDTGAVLWKGNSPLGDAASVSTQSDAWWITMNRIHRDVLYLQQFARPDMPTPGKIFAIDLLTGKLLWQNEELSLVGTSGDSIYGLQQSHDSSHGILLELNYRTGEEARRIPVDDPAASNAVDDASGQGHGIEKEEFVLPEFMEISDARNLFARVMPSRAINPTIIRFSGQEIIGYYLEAGKDEKGTGLYDAHIMISSGGKVIFRDIADRNVHSTFEEFFFVVPVSTGKGEVIYLKNSNEIVAVKI